MLLSFQQGNHPVGFGGASAQALDPVGPVAVEGAFVTLDFDVPLNGRVRIFDEGSQFAAEVDAAPIAMPVTEETPDTGFAMVTPFGPTG